MTMVDTEIRMLIDSGVLYSDDSCSAEIMHRSVGAIAYDLHTSVYTNNETVNMDKYRLLPGASVFVACKEIIRLPDDIIARIVLRNSRIRQGLALEAPVYQPGHHTRVFFRITNISSNIINLDLENGIAAIMFEKLDAAPEKPYNGAFQNEMAYGDMGDYTTKYKKEIEQVDEKLNEVRHLEKNIYANIITLMSIFIALFSLININVDIAFAENIDQTRLIISNLVTVGSIAFLVSLTQLCFSGKEKRSLWGCLLAIALIILAVATALVIA